MRPSIVASLLILAACTPTRSSQPTVTIAAGASAAPEAPVAEGSAALVWTATKDHSLSTRWIAPAAGGYRRIAETSGLLLAAGPDVWRWSAREEPVETHACEAPSARPPGKGSVTRVFLEKLGGPTRVEIVSLKVDTWANVIDHSATPVGSIGPYLFVREHTDRDVCTNHGSHSVKQSVWDVSRQAHVDLLTPEERRVVDTSDQATAQRLFSGEGDKKSVPLDQISYVASVPRYPARGFLSVEHIYTASVSYAGSDGEWSSSTRSVHVPASQVPARAQPFVQPPAAVTAYLADHPDEKISGWSTVSKDAAAVLASALGAR